MKDTYYFPHDFNAIQDPKMMSLFFEFGLRGIGFYWIIVEILHQQEDGRINEEEFRKYLRFYTKMESDDKSEDFIHRIEQVLNTFHLLRFVDGFVFSDRVLLNKKIRQSISDKRRKAGKRSAQVRKKSALTEKIKPSTCVEQNLTHVEQGKERKGKEIKDTNTVCDLEVSKIKKETVFNFEDVLSRYPNRIGKKRALVSFNASVKSEKDMDDINIALNNYLASERVKRNIIQNASTWFNNWRDWIDFKDPVEVVNEQDQLLREAGLKDGTSNRKRSYNEI